MSKCLATSVICLLLLASLALLVRSEVSRRKTRSDDVKGRDESHSRERLQPIESGTLMETNLIAFDPRRMDAHYFCPGCVTVPIGLAVDHYERL